MDDSRPLGDVTLRQLCECHEIDFRVFIDLIEANRTIRKKMPKGADHLLRRVFCRSEGEHWSYCYDPGDEPRMEMREITGSGQKGVRHD